MLRSGISLMFRNSWTSRTDNLSQNINYSFFQIDSMAEALAGKMGRLSQLLMTGLVEWNGAGGGDKPYPLSFSVFRRTTRDREYPWVDRVHLE